MQLLRYYTLIFCLAFFMPLVKAQYFNDDARLWLHLKFDKNISSKLNAELSLQNRIENNISVYSKLYSNLELSYKLNKNIRFLGGYGFGFYKNDNGTIGNRHRMYLGVLLRKKIKNVLFTYRNIYQASYYDINSSEIGAVPLFFDRNKITIKYEFNKRMDVYVSQELNLSYNQNDYDNISRSRTYIGTIYNLSKRSSIESYFMFQRRFMFKNQPKRDFVFGVTYSCSF